MLAVRVGTVVGIWACGWCAYYAIQEAVRLAVLRRRRARHPLPAPSPDGDWHGPADEPERRAIVAHFGALKFLGRYLNVTPEWREQGMWEWAYWKLVHSLVTLRVGWDGGLARDRRTAHGCERLEQLLPVHALDHEHLWDPATASRGITYTWIGQSTCLIQLNGVTILTDPVFGDQPIESMLSPRRMRPMPCTIEEIAPHIDVVLVSHNHYDHLDLTVIPHLAHAQWIMPTGTRHLVRGIAAANVHELSWWSEAALDITCRNAGGSRRELSVAAVPANHWSTRTLLDTNTSLWNSYAVRIGDASLFFCGDSGYSDSLFTAIGRMYGPFDLATIPIGSYAPRWHLSMQHMDPHGSVRVAQRIGARQSFGMHWGTWCMSDERWDAPPHDLALALKREQRPAHFLRTVAFGKTEYVRTG